eukprot:GHVU01039583.1.p1 GENE.GHVU01039583.1~~GHVU01039583.1.p1  ORF type:complete len:368 (-),score=44.07 GHVU01039583.1:643-1677(-)
MAATRKVHFLLRQKRGALPKRIGCVKDWVRILLMPCFYCGKESCTGRLNGFDRVSSHYGYALNTVVPCCTECNLRKGTTDIASFFKMVHAMHRRFVQEIPLNDFNFGWKAEAEVDTQVTTYRRLFWELNTAGYEPADKFPDDDLVLELLKGDCFCCERPKANGVDKIQWWINYVDVNMRSACAGCNFIFGRSTDDELKDWLKRVVKTFTRERLDIVLSRCGHFPHHPQSFREVEEYLPVSAVDEVTPLWIDDQIPPPPHLFTGSTVVVVLPGCPNIRIGDIPRHMSYTSCSAMSGSCFQVDTETVSGGASESISERSVSSSLVPTVVKLASAMRIYADAIAKRR